MNRRPWLFALCAGAPMLLQNSLVRVGTSAASYAMGFLTAASLLGTNGEAGCECCRELGMAAPIRTAVLAAGS